MRSSDDLHDEAEGLIAELRQRLQDGTHELDDRITAHPFTAVGLAFALGAVFALAPREPAPDVRRTLSGAVVAGLTALAIRGVKAYAWSRLSSTARGLFGASARERAASRDRSIESFLEH